MSKNEHTLRSLLPTSDKLGEGLIEALKQNLPAPPVEQATPAPAPLPEVMTAAAIFEWLTLLNQDIATAGLLPMTDLKIAGFTELLSKRKFTYNQAFTAEMFIIFGKKTDFRTKEVLPSYFFPTAEDLRPFKDEFLHTSEVDARERELKRQFETERNRWDVYAKRQSQKIEDLNKEIIRLKNEPAPMPDEMQPDVEQLKKSFESLLNSNVPGMRAQIKNLQSTKRLNERQIETLSDKAYALTKENLALKLQLEQAGVKVEVSKEERDILNITKLGGI